MLSYQASVVHLDMRAIDGSQSPAPPRGVSDVEHSKTAYTCVPVQVHITAFASTDMPNLTRKALPT